ncbi:enoyl-CoA hydratase [Pseudonocardia ammonioxydans]|uniref:Enoyl-CoA hydratase n=1 Tax=Pseudonocardia ammonioxydans TaxID=260086 RepID=A0A1I4S8G3_PSUAM|nr:hypothetical protein [Pseudonocardia ammonioxydans]SFM60777.1 enoyl-CoA hydratase [Pseudonocardia ammonioxydans]
MILASGNGPDRGGGGPTAIVGLPRTAVAAAKEAVDVAFGATLGEGVRFERHAFQALFATPDQAEGMAAFLEERTPDYGPR